MAKDSAESGFGVGNTMALPIDFLLDGAFGQGFFTPAQRIAILLMDVGEKNPNLGLTLREIGSALDLTSREVTRRMHDLRKAGLVVVRVEAQVKRHVFNWALLTVDEESLPNLKVYAELSRKLKRKHVKLLKAHRDSFREGDRKKLIWRMPREVFDYFHASNTWADGHYWTKVFFDSLGGSPDKVQPLGQYVLYVAWRYGQEHVLRSPTAFVRSLFTKDEEGKAKLHEYKRYREDWASDSRTWEASPSIAEHLGVEDAREEIALDELVPAVRAAPEPVSEESPEPAITAPNPKVTSKRKPVAKPVAKPVSEPEPSEPEPANDAPPARPERSTRHDASMGMAYESSLYEPYETPGMREQREEREEYERIKAARAAARAAARTGA